MNRPAGTAKGTEARASTRAENEKSLGKRTLVARGKDLNVHVAKPANQDDGDLKPAAKKPKNSSKRTGIPLKKVLEGCTKRAGDLSDVFKTMAADSKLQKEKENDEKALRRIETSKYRMSKMEVVKERNKAKAIKATKKDAIEERKISLAEKRLKLEENGKRNAQILDELKFLYGITLNHNSTPVAIKMAYARIAQLGKEQDQITADNNDA